MSRTARAVASTTRTIFSTTLAEISGGRLRLTSTTHEPQHVNRTLALLAWECQCAILTTAALALHSRECQTGFPTLSTGGHPHMKLKPLGDRLNVRAIEEEETTASGIVLPDTAKEKPQKGKVIAVGDGRYDDEGEKRIPLDVSEGDEVLYSKYGGTEIKVDGEDLLVLRESDVLAKVES